VVDASFFYLVSSIHPSSPQSVAPFGLSQRDNYKGHVFWDTESFMAMLPLLTDPAAARAILDYRFRRLEAARHNAMINGYHGIQFPWQSGAIGDEVTRVSAGGAGGAGEQHVNMDVALAFFPYGYSHSPEVDAATYRFFIEHDLEHYLALPMLSGFLGVIPARLGDRALARAYFDRGNLPFFTEPYRMSAEGAITAGHYQRVPDAVTTVFITGRGSLMAGLMLGLTRINFWKENLDDWFSGPIVMPEGWDGIVLEKVFLRGRPARITALHGAPRAEVVWLDSQIQETDSNG